MSLASIGSSPTRSDHWRRGFGHRGAPTRRALAAILDTALDVSRRRFLDMWNADPVVAERLRLSFVPIAGGGLFSASASL